MAGAKPQTQEPEGADLPGRVDPQRLHDLWERYGVASLEVFGSHARGDAGPDSDVDLLYVLKEGTRLGFRLFDLEDESTALLGTKVDLVAHSGINEHLRPPDSRRPGR